MDINDYQALAYKFANSNLDANLQLCSWALGITGEAGEVADLIKKHIGHGHELDQEKLVKEIGDVLWYISALASHLGIKLEDVATANIEKLQKRYPDGFSIEASKNRIEYTNDYGIHHAVTILKS